MKRLKVRSPTLKDRYVDENDNVVISSDLYCNLAGISKRTFFNWKKDKKIETKKEKYGATYVILPKDSIFLLKKDSNGDKGVEKLIKQDRQKRQLEILTARILKIQDDIANIARELKCLM